MIQEDNEILSDEYERILRGLAEMQKNGKLVLSENILERVTEYLEETNFLKGIHYLKDAEVDERLEERKKRKREAMEQQKMMISAIKGEPDDLQVYAKGLD